MVLSSYNHYLLYLYSMINHYHHLIYIISHCISFINCNIFLLKLFIYLLEINAYIHIVISLSIAISSMSINLLMYNCKGLIYLHPSNHSIENISSSYSILKISFSKAHLVNI